MSSPCVRAVVVALLASACGGGQEASGPDALVVTPAMAALIAGETVEVRAAFQKDGAEVEGGTVAWSTSNPDLATVESRGTGATITAIAAGAATITAIGGGLSATVDVTISPTMLTQIAISPEAPRLPAGTTTIVRVTATYNNHTTTEVAAQTSWSSDAPSIASVRGSTVTAFAKGEATITATYMGELARMRVTVLDPVLRSIDLVPTNPSVLIGQTRQLNAIGFFSDASTRDVTDVVTWESSMPAIATISNAAGSQGLASALAEGQTTISATGGRVIASTTLTVLPLGASP